MPTPGPLTFGGTTVEFQGAYTVTTLPDGKAIIAAVEENDDYRRTALRLGYGSDVLQMMRDHEATHAFLAHILGLPESPTLRNVAEGIGSTPLTDLEEAAVCSLQAFARAACVDLLDVFAKENAA